MKKSIRDESLKTMKPFGFLSWFEKQIQKSLLHNEERNRRSLDGHPQYGISHLLLRVPLESSRALNIMCPPTDLWPKPNVSLLLWAFCVTENKIQSYTQILQDYFPFLCMNLHLPWKNNFVGTTYSLPNTLDWSLGPNVFKICCRLIY